MCLLQSQSPPHPTRWRSTTSSCTLVLASHCILFEQLPRNHFRESPFPTAPKKFRACTRIKFTMLLLSALRSESFSYILSTSLKKYGLLTFIKMCRYYFSVCMLSCYQSHAGNVVKGFASQHSQRRLQQPAALSGHSLLATAGEKQFVLSFFHTSMRRSHIDIRSTTERGSGCWPNCSRPI